MMRKKVGVPRTRSDERSVSQMPMPADCSANAKRSWLSLSAWANRRGSSSPATRNPRKDRCCLSRPSPSQRAPARAAEQETIRRLHAAAALFGALGMGAAGPGDLAQGRADPLVALGKIGQRQDANQPLVAVEHRQAADLLLAHVLLDHRGVLVLEAVFDVAGHDLADRRAPALALGDGPHGNVAVADHADQAVAVLDRQDADVDCQHDPRRVLDAVIGTGDVDVSLHGFAYPHALLLVFEPRQRPNGQVSGTSARCAVGSGATAVVRSNQT